MKTLKLLPGILILSLMMMVSCQQEEDIFIDEGTETNSAESQTANFFSRVSAFDGSSDDILDGASCFSVILPVDVIVNGQELTLENENDFDLIKEIFSQFTNDDDRIIFKFPIEIQLNNYSRIIVRSQDQLEELRDACKDAREAGEDAISCLDIIFPITVLTFDTSSQQTGSIILRNEREAYNFIDNLDNNQFFSIQYPISARLKNNSTIIISSDQELIIRAEACKEEDDDEDEREEEAKANKKELEQILTDSTFKIESLISNGTDIADQFSVFTFGFLANGDIFIQNTITNLPVDSGGEFEVEAEAYVILELDFDSNTVFSILDDDFKVIAQSETEIKMESETDSNLKLTFKKI